MDGLNVFRGSDSVAQYFNPDNSPPLPLVEIPAHLNPYRQDGVRIYAKLLTALPAQNVKSLPAMNMLTSQISPDKRAIVEASSGSTVLSLGMLARVMWGNDDVTAYVTNKKHKDSLKLLRFFGLKVSLYGGLAQQEPTDPRGIMCRLRRLAKSDSNVCYPGQYDNENNWKAHERWTGPQILKQLPEINVFCTTVGTGGCITGTGSYLKTQKPDVTVLGVFNVFGDPTPGPRHLHGFQTCGFPWKSTVDTYTEVKSEDSYRMSMSLSREGIIAGPSSGQALRGLLDYIGSMRADDKLADIADQKSGEVACVFTCSDLPYQYLDGYFTKLGEDEFPPIQNEDRHDERWILEPRQALQAVGGDDLTSSSEDIETKGNPRSDILCSSHPSDSGSSRFKQRLRKILQCGNQGVRVSKSGCIQQLSQTPPSCIAIDIRNAEDFAREHVKGSFNVPLEGISADTAGGDLFGDASAVHWAWTGLGNLLKGQPACRVLDKAQKLGQGVLIICYDGEASRLATSALRAKGVEATSVLGGYQGLKELLVC